MQAYLSIRFQLTDGDIQKIESARDTLCDLRDAISKTGDCIDATEKLQQTVDLLTDIVMGKEI